MEKKKLLAALEIVKPGLANKEIIEQSTSFAFMNGSVVTYNDEISISHPVEGLDITGAVQASELYLILKKIKQEEIEVELTETELLMTAGRIKVGLTLQNEIKLPLEEVGTIEKWKSLPEDYLPAMKMAMYSTGSDNSKPVLTCVHVNKEGFIEGSDGFRIMKTILSKKVNIPTYLIPTPSVNIMLKMNPTKIAMGNGWIHFKSENETVLSCRILEDTFPETSSFLSVEGAKLSFPKNINEILDRASVFKKVEGSSLVEDVTVSMEKKKIKIFSTSETGRFEEEADVRYAGDKIEFGIVPSLLKNILADVRVCTFNEKLLKFEGENWEFVTVIKNASR